MFERIKNKFFLCLNNNLNFTEKELDVQLRHNIISLTVILAIFGLIYGLINNFFKHDYTGMSVNILGIVVFLTTTLILHIKKEFFNSITSILTIEFMLLFDLLILISKPSDLRHIWLLTFPGLIFFYKGALTWIRWVALFILSLFVVKLQPFVPIHYTMSEIIYIVVVIIMMTMVIYFYKARIDQGNFIITQQRDELERLAAELESKVIEKTTQLQQLNLSLEQKVQEKAKELIEKDALILAQSRQAAMGEMISMIAHQWRQPLSTITLQISNLKINSMLGKQTTEETHDALEHISQTIIYLSETIDDFQSFFKPNKKQEIKNICELVQRGSNFAKPRLKVANIQLNYTCQKKIPLLTYPNEFAQVIINILNNSIDALLEHQVEKPEIDVRIEENAEMVEIIISDNAGGISTENINTIFEPYYSTKGKNGTGLGLYMSKIIIEKELGGILSVKNSPKGAAFTIHLNRDTLT